jgi:23S rRNA pseudouridine1911/1915/1917 synthase
MEPGPVEAVVPAALTGERIDRAICTLTGMSRRVASDLVDSGAVSLDGAVVRVRSRKVHEGARLEILVPPPVRAEDTGSDPEMPVEFTVVDADEHVIIVDKPAGLVVHHGAGHHGGTLVDGLLERFPDLAALAGARPGDESYEGNAPYGDPGRPGIVHRLDKGTSGLMVVGRTEEAVRSLTEQLSSRTAGRQYLALVAGDVVHDQGVVDAPVGRSARMATRMAVTPSGRPARTAYRVLERMSGPPVCTLVEATLETGRTHQVRVHMAAIGHPVGGDDRYGEMSKTTPLMAKTMALKKGADQSLQVGRLFLHAHRLTIEHPTKGRVSWTSPLPEDLASVLEARRGPGHAAV